VNIDPDALPLTQYLVMETLAARHRTGETHWTFPTKATPAVRRLEDVGLVRWKSGIVERTILVWMTDAGRDLFLMPGYEAPGDVR
jgi:DNA-binding MarR family transcriptional regulator